MNRDTKVDVLLTSLGAEVIYSGSYDPDEYELLGDRYLNYLIASELCSRFGPRACATMLGDVVSNKHYNLVYTQITGVMDNRGCDAIERAAYYLRKSGQDDILTKLVTLILAQSTTSREDPLFLAMLQQSKDERLESTIQTNFKGTFLEKIVNTPYRTLEHHYKDSCFICILEVFTTAGSAVYAGSGVTKKDAMHLAYGNALKNDWRHLESSNEGKAAVARAKLSNPGDGALEDLPSL